MAGQATAGADAGNNKTAGGGKEQTHTQNGSRSGGGVEGGGDGDATTREGAVALLRRAFAEPESSEIGSDQNAAGTDEDGGAEQVEAPVAQAESESESDAGAAEDGNQESGEAEGSRGDAEDAEDDEKSGDADGVERKLFKLREKRREAEAKLAESAARVSELEARLEALESAAGSDRGGDGQQVGGAPRFQSEKEIAAVERGAERLLDDLDEYLEGGASEEVEARVKAHLKEAGIPESQARQARRKLDRMLTRDLPQERQALSEYRAKEAEAEAQVKAHLPEMLDRTSAIYGQAMQVVKAMPEIKRMPHWKLAAGIYAVGLEAMKARLQRGQKSEDRSQKTRSLPPKQPVSAAPVGRTVAPRSEQLRAQLDEALASGSKDGQTAYVREVLRGV